MALKWGSNFGRVVCRRETNKCLARKAQGKAPEKLRGSLGKEYELCDAECNCQVGCAMTGQFTFKCNDKCGTKKSFLSPEDKARHEELKTQLGKMQNCIAEKVAKCTGESA